MLAACGKAANEGSSADGSSPESVEAEGTTAAKNLGEPYTGEWMIVKAEGQFADMINDPNSKTRYVFRGNKLLETRGPAKANYEVSVDGNTMTWKFLDKEGFPDKVYTTEMVDGQWVWRFQNSDQVFYLERP